MATTALTTPTDLQAEARRLALRAGTLLAEAEAEIAAGSPASVPARATYRVQAAQAYAMASLSLSSLILPAVAPPPPAPPPPAG